jgi:hypothetical protein
MRFLTFLPDHKQMSRIVTYTVSQVKLAGTRKTEVFGLSFFNSYLVMIKINTDAANYIQGKP